VVPDARAAAAVPSQAVFSRWRASTALIVASILVACTPSSSTRVDAPAGGESALVATLPPTVPPDETSVATSVATTAPSPTQAPTTAASTTPPVTAPQTTAVPTTVPWSVAPGAFAGFDESLASRLIGRGAFGLSVAVARDGRMVHTAGLGIANAFNNDPVRPESRFRIASVSKTLLAIAVMQMVDEGVLSLDAPVLEPLAGSLGVELGDAAMAAITVRHLLGHSSGIPEYDRTFFGGIVSSCRDAARRGLERGLVGPPGTSFHYSNMNYCLLGMVVEQATGNSYVDEIQARVLAPLGIDDMAIGQTTNTSVGDVLHATTVGRNFLEALGPAGAWLGTAEDLVRILDSLDSRRPGHHPLPPELVTTMVQPGAFVPYPVLDRWYGLGLIVYDGGRSWGHTGSVEGARAIVVHRDDGITWSVLVNGSVPGDADRLRTYVDEALATVNWTSG
jgi:D-alanyl-D-alanine carboxypeptidase